MLAGITDRIFNRLAVVTLNLVHLVPLSIDEHIGKAERNGHIDVFLDNVVVVAAVVVGPVNPGDDSWLNP